ncbi:MAG: hypothetical protein JSS16_05730 [Proteobacteria bacterium]|nr:hypothetical protein [Pseudomonadota bacterium]
MMFAFDEASGADQLTSCGSARPALVDRFRWMKKMLRYNGTKLFIVTVFCADVGWRAAENFVQGSEPDGGTDPDE